MKHMGRLVLVTVVVFAFAGCGGQVSPTGTTGAASASHSKSWMLPEASGEDLIYVGSYDRTSQKSSVYVYSYPHGSLVGTLTGFAFVNGLCSDSSGDVWITNDGKTTYGPGTIYKYAHGASNPEATLQYSYRPLDCTSDLASGNLAVSGIHDVAIYKHGTGEPTYYSAYLYANPAYFISYDGSGNLYFADDNKCAAYLRKRDNFVTRFYGPVGAYQWDGTYLTVLKNTTIKRYLPKDGHSGRRYGSVELGDYTPCNECWDSIEGSLLAVAAPGQDEVFVYEYPKGGAPTLTISVKAPGGVAISVPPSGRDNRETRPAYNNPAGVPRYC